ncbi:MAG: LysR family transcriptional regulator [bacterium]|nr:LysR family transcriptional regulator [bacterium]
MEKRFMRAEEVASELGVSVSYAYKVIRMLNDELKEKGYITVAGKVSRQYFNERFYGSGKEE